MAIFPGNIIRFKVFQRIAGQQVLNVQHYRVDVVPDAGANLLFYIEDLSQQWKDSFRVMQCNQLFYIRTSLEILGQPDLAEYSYPTGEDSQGQVVADYVSPFAAVSVRQVRESRLTRNGFKRFAGPTETQTSGGVLNAVTVTAWESAANARFVGLQQILNSEFGTFMLLNPIIWGDVSPAYPEGRYSDIRGVLVSPNISTQNSRKVRAVEGV